MANRPTRGNSSTSTSTSSKPRPGTRTTRSAAFAETEAMDNSEVTWGRGGSGSQKRAASSGGSSKPNSQASSSTRRMSRHEEMRAAVSGQEHEYIGLAFIVAGVLTGLALYFKLAGLVGRGVSNLLGWLTGWGRFFVPIALIGVGVGMIRKGRIEQRLRLLVGVGVLSGSFLGLLHIARGAGKITVHLDSLAGAGGWIGALIGQPLRALLAPAGAVVLLVAAAIGGLLLITRRPLREVVAGVLTFIPRITAPLRSAAGRAVGGVSTLSSERTATRGTPRVYDVDAEESWSVPGEAQTLPLPAASRPAKPKAPRPLPPPTLADAAPSVKQAELELGPGAKRGVWTLPPSSYLVKTGAQTINKAEVDARGRTLHDALESHGVETRLVGATVGPTVTRYELELGAGVKVARVTTLQRDIAYSMAATDVRILAPIPGRSAIGVEVPNHTRQLVSLGDILIGAEAREATHPLDVAVGKDIAGRAVFLNLATTPHLLIAGATGAGKSSGINCIITSLLMRATPDQVRLILIDPKQVEMGQYARLPHLLTQPVTNPKKAANALSWAVKEMERRYDLLYEVGFRDIAGYNAAFDRGDLKGEEGSDKTFERLPYIVVVVDELNDLMMVAARDVEESITRIAQKARAVGVHLIVATQRPSVNVITGVIKANIPARMAFAVSSLTDSRVILDQPGAEKLVGKGDMLLLPGNSNVAQRIQGSFVSEEEVRKVVAFWRRQAPEVSYVSGVEGDDNDSASRSSSLGGSSGGDEDDDESLMRQARELVVRSQLGSTSMLQRKLKVGFARAGRIMDLMENRGIVGPSEGSKARTVLMSVDELELVEKAERGG